MRALLAVLAAAALSACATTTTGAGANGPQVQWRCDHGAAFSFHMSADGNAEVFAGGQLYHLPGVPSADGNRYSDGSVEYWEKGGEAMLTGAAGGPYENCHS